MIKNNLKATRRDFLKLASLIPATWLSKSLLEGGTRVAPQDNTPNVFILIFDAWSASNVSLYGYPRNTMPNLEKFAERSTVYHNHISAGTFTSPGVASILTGLYPWSHRLFQLGNLITDNHIEHQLFSLLKENFTTTIGYSQNKAADQILEQLEGNIDDHISPGAYNLYNSESYDAPIYSFESIKSIVSALRSDSSLFIGPILRAKGLYNEKVIHEKYLPYYPKGLPNAIKSLFLLESVVARTIETLDSLDHPCLGYMHFFPPHEPYSPKTRFYGKFRDDWLSPDKGIHPLAVEKDDYEKLTRKRRLYDEFLASWDFELGRLFEFLVTSGLRENSYIIITSDHGEMFERGEPGHWTPLVYDPLVRVPLIISRPGQQTREDIYTNTSSVDILPTIAHLTGTPLASWMEGQILPGQGGEENASRSIFSMDAKENSVFAKLTKSSVALTKDRYRLTYYDYPDYQNFEFYNLVDDPEEMHDLYPLQSEEAVLMREELLDKLADVNRPFTQKD